VTVALAVEVAVDVEVRVAVAVGVGVAVVVPVGVGVAEMVAVGAGPFGCFFIRNRCSAGAGLPLSCNCAVRSYSPGTRFPTLSVMTEDEWLGW